MLVPDAGSRDELRQRTHAAILREEHAVAATLVARPARKELRRLADAPASPANTAEIVACFRDNYEGPLDPEVALRLAGRAAAITGAVLEGEGKRYPVLTKPLFWLARVARLIWGFAELLLPGGTTLRSLIRRWANLGLLCGAVLIAVGIATGTASARHTGWTLVAATLVGQLGAWAAGAKLGNKWLVLPAVALGAAVVGLAIYGANELITHGP